MTKKKSRFDYAMQEAEQALIANQVQAPVSPAQLSRQAGSAADALRNPAAYQLPPRRRSKESNEPGRMEIERVQMNVRIRPELKRALAGLAGLQGMSVNDAVEAAVVAYLQNNKPGKD